MNFLEFKYPDGRTNLRIGDIVIFRVLAEDGSRKTVSWIAPITKIKAHKLEVFIPAKNAYDWIRNSIIDGFEASVDDLNPNSKASQILRFASSRIKDLAFHFMEGARS